MTTLSREPEETLAQQFHAAYERLAPAFSYTTRTESAKPWDEVPEQNRNLMIAVCREILTSRCDLLRQREEEIERLKEKLDRQRDSDHANACVLGLVVTSEVETLRAQLAASKQDTQDMIWERDDLLQNLTMKDSELGALKGQLAADKSFIETTQHMYLDAVMEKDIALQQLAAMTQERVCAVCKHATDLACSDCQIDLATTVYVCATTACRTQHERTCPGALLRERTAIQQAISVEFAKKAYTDEDRAHEDLLENVGVFLDHHQALEQQLTASQERVKELELINFDHELNKPVLEARCAELADAGEMLWATLAHVSGGDWTKQTPEWQEAAARFRDKYFAALTTERPPT